MKAICNDLSDEYTALDDLVAHLSHGDWERKTPFFGWTIKDQISHLAYFDRAACLSASDADGFKQHLDVMIHNFTSYDDLHNSINAEGGRLTVPELLSHWRTQRAALLLAFSRMDPGKRLPWYGPPMSARSSATARLMETWAHGQDIRDTLGVLPEGNDRLKHIAHLGYSTYSWSFVNRGMEKPSEAVRLELEAPDGEIWSWGEEGLENLVYGPALDFCLVVTQRRHMDDTRLGTEGREAAHWMRFAQAFAGPPEKGPEPFERVPEINQEIEIKE